MTSENAVLRGDSSEPRVISQASPYEIPLPPGDDEINRKLREEEFTCTPKNMPGVRSYDIVRVASNMPCEDNFTHAVMVDPVSTGSDWMAWGVFDGHVSWEMSAQLKQTLIPAVWSSLKSATSSSAHSTSSSSTNDNPPTTLTAPQVAEAVKAAFTTLDSQIVSTAASALQSTSPFSDIFAALKVATAGSCALLALYDPLTHHLHVACVGDSRAVLGTKSLSTGTWSALPLSTDQTGNNADEVARITAEHPGEEGIVKGKPARVLGIMVSRAFGDVFWKWDAELQKTLAKTYFNGLYPKMIPFAGLETPPYLIAEPVVTCTKLELGGGEGEESFLIMASDGFWDHVSNEQAVKLVRAWVECQSKPGREGVVGDKDAKIDRVDEEQWKWHDGVLVVKDDNVATHLVRNALGGSDEEFLRAMFAFEYPRTRNMRDDITVQVIFFGDK